MRLFRPKWFKLLRDFVALNLWTIKLIYPLTGWRLPVLFFLSFFEYSYPLINAYLLSRVLDKAQYSIQSGAGFETVLPEIILLLGVNVATKIFDQAVNYFDRLLYQELDLKLDSLLYRKIASLGVQTIALPEVADLIERARMGINRTHYFTQQMISYASILVALVGSIVIVIQFAPILVLIALIVGMINFFINHYFTQKLHDHWRNNTEERRRHNWLGSYLLSPIELPEIIANNSFEFIAKKYEAFSRNQLRYEMRIAYKREFFSILTQLVDFLVELASYLWAFSSAFAGAFAIGTAVFYANSVRELMNKTKSIAHKLTESSDAALKVADVKLLFDMQPTAPDGNISLPIDVPLEIKFENVSFKYPGSDRLILRDFNLHILSNEKIALIGANGSGKTTIVKLILRIYRPTAGRILINGIDLNDLKIDNWYEHVGILFQEFNFFGSLSAGENVYVGKPTEDYAPEKIWEAVERADAKEFIETYPKQLDQIMSDQIDGGIRPSGGQMQKLAIARFFFRNSPLAIFDEPTASIDAVSEYNIFNQIYNFFENKTVIIISHRFSTVRNADRIVVIAGGEIKESGTHQDLLRLEGEYAHAFRLQAQGYVS